MTPELVAKLRLLSKELKMSEATMRKTFRVLDKYSLDVYKDIIQRSPVGSSRRGYTGGSFRAAWHMSNLQEPGVLWGVRYSNNMPYAGPLEYGSPRGGLPWPSATGVKTIEVKGKIYSSQAPGGVVGPVLDRRKFLDAVNNAVVSLTSTLFKG